MRGSQDETLRAFVALELDAPSSRRIGRVSDRLRMGSGAPSATWTPAPKMHVTLKFLGDLALEDVAPLGQALRPIAEGIAPCHLTHLTLYRSELEPEGANHVPLARFAFGLGEG